MMQLPLRPGRRALPVLAMLAAGAGSLETAGAQPTSLARPQLVHPAPGLGPEEAEALLRPALLYYAFWDTGDERLAREALAPDFVDLNLPPGRPQGLEGPLVASRTFRQAVPDLRLTVDEVWLTSGTVIGRLRFTGRFSGTFEGTRGQGQVVGFSAVDIYQIRSGQIVSNWHLEDNLTLLRQLGLAAAN